MLWPLFGCDSWPVWHYIDASFGTRADLGEKKIPRSVKVESKVISTYNPVAIPILPDKWRERGGGAVCPQPRQLHLLPSILVLANLLRCVLTAESPSLLSLSKTASAWPETNSYFSLAPAADRPGQSDPWKAPMSLANHPHPT